MRSPGCARGVSGGSREARTRCRSTLRRGRRGRPRAIRWTVGNSRRSNAENPSTVGRYLGPGPVRGGDGRRATSSLHDLVDLSEGQPEAVRCCSSMGHAQKSREGSIQAEHATDLGEGGIGIEMVERVPDDDGVGDSPSRSGIPSAVPATVVTSGWFDPMIARMLAAGSTATTRTPSGCEPARELAGPGGQVHDESNRAAIFPARRPSRRPRAHRSGAARRSRSRSRTRS